MSKFDEVLEKCIDDVDAHNNIKKFILLALWSFRNNFKEIQKGISFDSFEKEDFEKFIEICNNRLDRSKVFLHEIAIVLGFDLTALTFVITKAMDQTKLIVFIGAWNIDITPNLGFGLAAILFIILGILFILLGNYRSQIHAWTAFKEKALMEYTEKVQEPKPEKEIAGNTKDVKEQMDKDIYKLNKEYDTFDGLMLGEKQTIQYGLLFFALSFFGSVLANYSFRLWGDYSFWGGFIGALIPFIMLYVYLLNKVYKLEKAFMQRNGEIVTEKAITQAKEGARTMTIVEKNYFKDIRKDIDKIDKPWPLSWNKQGQIHGLLRKYKEDMQKEYIQKYVETKIAIYASKTTYLSYLFGLLALIFTAYVVNATLPEPNTTIHTSIFVLLVIILLYISYISFNMIFGYDPNKDIIISIEEEKLIKKIQAESTIFHKTNGQSESGAEKKD